MEFSKSLVVETTLENTKPAGADEVLEEVQDMVMNASKLGVWKVEVPVKDQSHLQIVLWVAAKLKRMGFEVDLKDAEVFVISWQN